MYFCRPFHCKFHIQVRSCNSVGTECYHKYISQNKIEHNTCLKSCHGIYGDIQHITQDDTVTISKNGEPTETLFKEYLDYKRGFETNYLAYFSNITGSHGSPFLTEFVTNDWDIVQEKLQVVEIYFDTPTFDKITRDAKTTNVGKISSIGGHLGLLTGK